MKPAKSIPLFEQMVWTLKGSLMSIIDDAQKEVGIAESSGDANAIEKAKEALVSQARHKRHWIGDEALWNYCQANKDSFK